MLACRRQSRTEWKEHPIPDQLNASHDPADFRAQLIERGLLIPMGVDGLYGRGVMFEDIIERINALASSLAAQDGAEVMRFPPAMGRQHLQESEFLITLPHLAGCVHSFQGNQDEHHALLDQIRQGQDWSDKLSSTAVALTPAACYPAYPVVAARGRLPAEGQLVDVYAYCFRHEPSIDPARMQMFRMREFVFMGTPDQTIAFRERWLQRSGAFAHSLGLPAELALANDPFFGPASRYLAGSQRQKQLKFELLVPFAAGAPPTACMSFNYHEDHFGRVWRLQTAAGAVAHTACVGFGVERLALALFRLHGFAPEAWPAGVRDALGLADGAGRSGAGR